VSIGELWAEMDMIYAISREGTSVGNAPRNAHHERRSVPLVKTTGESSSHTDKGALLDDTPGSSNAPPRGRGKCSAKNKATQILSGAPGAISLRMWRSFVDRQYSPSTGMDLSEWEIILDELTRMGYIVKKEPDSDGNE
jgi:hypothetical protein